MCVAVPGKVVEINGDVAKVEVMGNMANADIRLVKAEVGDYVLLHAGIALEVMKKEMAEEMLWLFQELGEVVDENP